MLCFLAVKPTTLMVWRGVVALYIGIITVVQLREMGVFVTRCDKECSECFTQLNTIVWQKTARQFLIWITRFMAF